MSMLLSLDLVLLEEKLRSEVEEKFGERTWDKVEVVKIKGTDEVLVRVNPDFYRPTEVDSLVGDSTFTKKTLGWKPKYSFADLVKEMCDSDMGATK